MIGMGDIDLFGLGSGLINSAINIASMGQDAMDFFKEVIEFYKSNKDHCI